MGGGPTRPPPILYPTWFRPAKSGASGRRAAVRVIAVADREQVLLRARRRVLVRLFFRVSVIQAAWNGRLAECRPEKREAGALPVVPYLNILEERDVLLLHDRLQSRWDDRLSTSRANCVQVGLCCRHTR